MVSFFGTGEVSGAPSDCGSPGSAPPSSSVVGLLRICRFPTSVRLPDPRLGLTDLPYQVGDATTKLTLSAKLILNFPRRLISSLYQTSSCMIVLPDPTFVRRA